jgi:hypothetical protein
MENVSQTLFGGSYLDAALTQGSLWLYQFKIKHNPSGIWFGPNKNDFQVSVYNGNTNSTSIATATVSAFTQGSFLHQELDFDVSCGVVTGTADSFAGGGATAGPLANFNYLQFLTQDLPLPISFSLSGDSSCTLASLIGTYTTQETVASVQWEYPLNTIISTDSAILINTLDVGDYIFRVILANGCEITETITIP